MIPFVIRFLNPVLDCAILGVPFNAFIVVPEGGKGRLYKQKGKIHFLSLRPIIYVIVHTSFEHPDSSHGAQSEAIFSFGQPLKRLDRVIPPPE
jgi:hypothetical protein